MHEEDEECKKIIREIDKIMKEKKGKLSYNDHVKLCRMRNECVFYLQYGVWFT